MINLSTLDPKEFDWLLHVKHFQFQAFSQYRSKLLKKGKDEVEILRENTKVYAK